MCGSVSFFCHTSMCGAVSCCLSHQHVWISFCPLLSVCLLSKARVHVDRFLPGVYFCSLTTWLHVLCQFGELHPFSTQPPVSLLQFFFTDASFAVSVWCCELHYLKPSRVCRFVGLEFPSPLPPPPPSHVSTEYIYVYISFHERLNPVHGDVTKNKLEHV